MQPEKILTTEVTEQSDVRPSVISVPSVVNLLF